MEQFIPDDIIYELSLFYVGSVREILTLSLVSKRFRKVLERYGVWKFFFLRRWPSSLFRSDKDYRFQVIEQARKDLDFDPLDFLHNFVDIMEVMERQEDEEEDFSSLMKCRQYGFRRPIRQYISRVDLSKWWFRGEDFEMIFTRQRCFQYSLNFSITVRTKLSKEEKVILDLEEVVDGHVFQEYYFERPMLDSDSHVLKIVTVCFDTKLYSCRRRTSDNLLLLLDSPNKEKEPGETFDFWKILHRKYLLFAIDGLFDDNKLLLERCVGFLELLASKAARKDIIATKNRIMEERKTCFPFPDLLPERLSIEEITSYLTFESLTKKHQIMDYCGRPIDLTPKNEEEDTSGSDSDDSCEDSDDGNHFNQFSKQEKFRRAKRPFHPSYVKKSQISDEKEKIGGHSFYRREKSRVIIGELVHDDQFWIDKNNQMGEESQRNLKKMLGERIMWEGSGGNETYIYTIRKRSGMMGDMNDSMYQLLPLMEFLNKYKKYQTIVSWAAFLAVVSYAMYLAYEIRLFAIRDVWPGIHEFDPWFNFRATKYMEENGWSAFFKWYDHRSWYPIGRPVGTTIYPGLQIASIFIYRTMKLFGGTMSLYDVCVYFPAWFGAVATFFTGLLGWEIGGNVVVGCISSMVMAVIPCHTMRSIGGGFDNESLAYTLIISTFYFWVRSLRKEIQYSTVVIFGVISGISGAFMAATWGGYIFVVNMIGIHALFTIVKYLVLSGEWEERWKSFYTAFCLWYVISTIGSIYVPVINWAPLRSMENLLPLGVFILLQILLCSELFGKEEKKKKKSPNDDDDDEDEEERRKLRKRKRNRRRRNQVPLIPKRVNIMIGGFLVSFMLFLVLYMMDFFGPLTHRVRSLFIEHSKTGNPLVDSVAEHQPTNERMYDMFLGVTGKIGYYAIWLCFYKRTDAKYFLLFFSVIVYYFCGKMNRLIILGAAPASLLTGLIGSACFWWILTLVPDTYSYAMEKIKERNESMKKKGKKKGKKQQQQQHQKKKKKKKRSRRRVGGENFVEEMKTKYWVEIVKHYRSPLGLGLRVLGAYFIIMYTLRLAPQFYETSQHFARHSANPVLVFKTRLKDGRETLIDDYLLAYEWLRDNTPEDSRVLAWWDYGYQITGVGERISLADGNTWNLEHIAFIGRMLTAPQKEAWETARHVADYVLVWSGHQGGDLAKSPHIARISSSVYDICGSHDPLCHGFGFSQDPVSRQMIPSPSMRASLLYNLVMNGQNPDVYVNQEYFKERYRSKYNLVRIYQVMNTSPKSKRWAADPENWVCDAPGSWYCKGQYPPAVSPPPKTHRDIKYDSKGNLVLGK